MEESKDSVHANTKPENQKRQQRHEAVSTDPKTWQYDKNKTIDYQIRLLPNESTFTKRKWKDIASSFYLEKPVLKRRNDVSDAADLTWEINSHASRNGSYADYNEFGYDKDGYVSEFALGQAIPPAQAGTGATPQQPLNSLAVLKEIKEHIVSPLPRQYLGLYIERG